MTLCLTYLYKAYFAYVELTTDLFICLVELKPVKQEVIVVLLFQMAFVEERLNEELQILRKD